ncbi:MAG: hypothetical protein GY928_08500, partial [Colwellia sp.]|nr:hypothetical protein [Colwellia sp.]
YYDRYTAEFSIWTLVFWVSLFGFSGWIYNTFSFKRILGKVADWTPSNYWNGRTESVLVNGAEYFFLSIPFLGKSDSGIETDSSGQKYLKWHDKREKSNSSYSAPISYLDASVAENGAEDGKEPYPVQLNGRELRRILVNAERWQRRDGAKYKGQGLSANTLGDKIGQHKYRALIRIIGTTSAKSGIHFVILKTNHQRVLNYPATFTCFVILSTYASDGNYIKDGIHVPLPITYE